MIPSALTSRYYFGERQSVPEAKIVDGGYPQQKVFIMLKKQIIRFSGLVATAGLAFSLAACGGSSQSVADACDILEKEMTAIEGEMDAALTEAMSGDGGDIGSAFDPVVKGLEAATAKISNDEVKAAAQGFSATVKDFSASMASANIADLDFTDPAAIEELEKFSELVTAKGEDLEAAGDKIATLCDVK